MEPFVGHQELLRQFDVAIEPETGGSIVAAGPANMICFGPDDDPTPPIPALRQYEADVKQEIRDRLGPRRDLLNPFVATVFPNFSMLRAGSRTFRVWHPKGPDKVEVRAWGLLRQGRSAGDQRDGPLGGHPRLQPLGHL